MRGGGGRHRARPPPPSLPPPRSRSSIRPTRRRCIPVDSRLFSPLDACACKCGSRERRRRVCTPDCVEQASKRSRARAGARPAMHPCGNGPRLGRGACGARLAERVRLEGRSAVCGRSVGLPMVLVARSQGRRVRVLFGTAHATLLRYYTQRRLRLTAASRVAYRGP